MKYAISFFALLLLLITGILLFQYQVYSSKLEEGKDSFTYSQEIEVIYRNNSLDIRQHFKNLSKQSISIQWPEKAKNPSCLMASKTSCDRLTEDATRFKVGDSRNQSVSYIIPLDGGLKSKQLIQDVFAELSNGTVSYTTIHISTDSRIVGQWVTGLPFIGQQTLSLVNYSMFSGEGHIDELYWQASGLAIQYEQPIVSIYSAKPVTAALSGAIDKMDFLNENHISIIQGKNSRTSKNSRILFLPELSVSSIERNVILSQVLSKYDFKGSPEWLSEYVASYFVQSNLGSSKTKKIKAQLDNYLTEADAVKWLATLEELQGQTISPKILDEKLSSIIQGKTSYFQMNTNSDKIIYPVLIEDNRAVYIDEMPYEDVKVILYEGQILYSAAPILKTLGYVASEGENGYYVNSATRVFRFPKEPGFYVFNQRRYNTLSEPVTKIGDQYYIEEAWLTRLFLVDLKKSDKRIDITKMTE